MIELTPVTERHRDQLRAWRNDPSVSQFMYTTHQISQAEHNAWFDRLQSSDDRRAWIIAMDGIDVGATFMTGIDHDNSRASWAFYLADPRTRGKGVGSATEYRLLEIAFIEMKLHKLCAEVLSFNSAVFEMHKKFGFTEEGRLKEHWHRDGKWVDVHVIAMFRPTWLAHREEFHEKLSARGLV